MNDVYGDAFDTSGLGTFDGGSFDVGSFAAEYGVADFGFDSFGFDYDAFRADYGIDFGSGRFDRFGGGGSGGGFSPMPTWFPRRPSEQIDPRRSSPPVTCGAFVRVEEPSA